MPFLPRIELVTVKTSARGEPFEVPAAFQELHPDEFKLVKPTTSTETEAAAEASADTIKKEK